MTRFRHFSVLLALLLGIGFGSCRASADSLQLRDGRHLDGHYVGGTESMVAFFANGSVEYFPVANVLLVVFGQEAAPDSLGASGLSMPGVKPMNSRRSTLANHSPKKIRKTGRNDNRKPVLQTVSSHRGITL